MNKKYIIPTLTVVTVHQSILAGSDSQIEQGNSSDPHSHVPEAKASFFDSEDDDF